MLRAYFDRSELFKPSGVVAVAGYLSTVDAWVQGEKNWNEVLSSVGVNCFHMTDFENGQGEFKGWSKAQKKACIKRLLGVINRRAVLGSGVAICTADYTALPAAQTRMLFGPPYALCAVIAVVQMMRWVRDHGGTVVACVFELGDKGAGVITTGLNMAKQRNSDFDKRLLSVSFEKKTNMWGLQAADVLAYETVKQLLRKTGADQRDPRRSLVRLLKRTRHVGTYLDSAALQRLLGDDEQASSVATV